MAEQLELTDPVVVPEKVTSHYRIVTLTLDSQAVQTAIPQTTEAGLVLITVIDNQGVSSAFRYTGPAAREIIKFLNTGNFTNKSMQKRLLEKLSRDGYLPGTVTGAPDPPLNPLDL